jgi:AraC-like DNA-binding protein
MNGSAPSGNSYARLWFQGGKWWFSRPGDEPPCDISRMIRDKRYRIDPICRYLGVGRRTFERVVSDSLGIAPGLWLRRQRAVAARHRLREGASVKQLAVELGFGNASRFSDEFKRWYGVSPSGFQREEHARMASYGL